MKTWRRGAWIACLLLGACASTKDTAVFVTKTSFGLDVQATPSAASVGYDRVEGYFGPRYDTGTVPAVAGTFQSDGGLFDRKVRQTYATGTAAHAITAASSAVAGTPTLSNEVFDGDRKAMFFGTNTVLGIRMGFGAQVVQDFSFGFRRQEMSSIPVASSVTTSVTSGGTTTAVVNSFAPVFAHFDNLTKADPDASKVNVRQMFATGRAAEQLAFEVRHEFLEEARQSVLAEYRDNERLQTNSALRALHCVARLPDDKLRGAWDNAESARIFADPTVPQQLRAANAHDACEIYTGRIALIDANSRDRTTRLAVHADQVCKL